ncbi:MAG: hypothetical protein IKD80_02375, partial [Selenomonadaceae bacterium]|nr:hypothetical protein [Selenomonadaceae bacterium]
TDGKFAFWDSVNTINVFGEGNTTIYTDLVGTKDTVITGADITINAIRARFKVTESSGGDYFVVNNTDAAVHTAAAPEITGARKITLLDGSITLHDDNKVITMDEGGPQLENFTAGMTVTLRGENVIVQGKATDKSDAKFDFNNKTYTIADGDGMKFNFKTNDPNYLVISELDVDDAFKYGGETYSVKGAGFIRVGDDMSMWRIGDTLSPHGLSDETVSLADLTNESKWGPIATVDTTYKSIALPSIVGSDTITLVGGDFEKVYGVFTGVNGDYTLDGVTETVNTARLGQVTVQGGMRSLSATAKLTNVTVYSPAATYAVIDDKDDGWQVNFNNNVVSVADAEYITMFGGAFQVDSDAKASLDVANSIISATGDSSTIIVTGTTNGATISDLNVGESFNIANRGDYTMKAVGLTQNGKYLFNSKDGVVPLSDINTDSLWGALISASALTINSSAENALIVDGGQSILYADLVVDGTTISMRKADGGATWDTSNIIYVDNTLVGFTDDFTGSVSIAGIQSKATVNVTEINPFTFKDAGTGALIDSVDAYNLTGGLVTVKTGQTVSAAAGTLSADGGNGVTFNVGDTSADSATIGALDTGDTITVNDSIYSVFNVGIMTDSDELLRDTKSQKSITVQELDNTEKIKTITVTDSVLAVSKTIAEGTSYVAIDPGRNTRYGMISVVSGGDFSMWKDPLDTAWNSNYTISADNQRVTLTTNYLGANLRGVNSGAEFQVLSLSSTLDSNFSFYDAYTGATLSPEVASVTQTAGLIALNDYQSIFVGGNQITDTDIDGKSNIAVSVNAGAATITAIDSGDVFSIKGTSYGLLSNGRMVRINDNKIYSGDPIDTSNGSIAVNDLLGNEWNEYHSIETDENDVLTIGASAVYDAAFVVGDEVGTVHGGYSFPTEIYGTLTYTNNKIYSLTTDGKPDRGKELKGVVVTSDAQPVEFSTDFLSLP